MESSVRKEEIDLLDVAVSLVRHTIRNAVWVAVLTLGCGIAGYLVSKQWSEYEATLMIKSTRLSKEELEFLLQDYERIRLRRLAREVDDLSVRGFKFKVTKKTTVDRLDTHAYGTITATVGDTTFLPKIEADIITYLNRQGMVTAYYEIEQESNKKMVEEYRDKIRRAEALVATKPAAEAVVMFPEILTMHARLNEHEAALKNKNLIELTSGFHAEENTLDPIKTTTAGIAVGMFLSILFILLKSFIAYYRKVNILES